MEALQKRRAQKARVLLLFGLLENQFVQLYLFGGHTLRGRILFCLAYIHTTDAIGTY